MICFACSQCDPGTCGPGSELGSPIQDSGVFMFQNTGQGIVHIDFVLMNNYWTVSGPSFSLTCPAQSARACHLIAVEQALGRLFCFKL